MRGGAGGVWQAALPRQGLFDAVEPWERPAGSLTVCLRYPACFLGETAITSCLAAKPVHLLGSGGDAVAASLAAGSITAMLANRREATEMAAEAALAPGHSCGGGHDSGGSQGSSPRSACSTSSSMRGSEDEGGRGGGRSSATAFCLVLGLQDRLNGAGADESGCRSGAAPTCSPAAAAMLRALRLRVPGLQARTASACSLLDDEWEALQRADVIILDAPLLDRGGSRSHASTTASSSGAGHDAAITAKQVEQLLVEAAAQLAEAGLLELLWQRFWAGALLAGIGQACALLGRQAGDGCSSVHSAPPLLPWYLLRAGGGAAGWACLHAALSAATAVHPAGATDAGAGQAVVGAGVMVGGCWLVHPCRGTAEMLVAPCRDFLVATAAWAAQTGNDPAQQGLQEADADWGFFCELSASGQP